MQRPPQQPPQRGPQQPPQQRPPQQSPQQPPQRGGQPPQQPPWGPPQQPPPHSQPPQPPPWGPPQQQPQQSGQQPLRLGENGRMPQPPPAQHSRHQRPPQNYARPQSIQERQRLATYAGLNVADRHNPSPLEASVIAHREKIVARSHTQALQALEQEPVRNAPVATVAPPMTPNTPAMPATPATPVQQGGPATPATPAVPKEKEKEKDEAPKKGGKPHRVGGFLRKRVPVLLQMSEVECGAASLAMILRYYGRKTSISEVSERASVGRDGLSALNIVKTARGYGMRVRAISLKENNFRNVSLPAIIHWQFNHFLVLERWSPTWVDLVDPASGRKRITAEEFDNSFTGVVVTMEPGTQFVRNTSAQQITLGTYVAQYVKRAPMVLVQIIFASLFLQLFGLAVPVLTKLIIDDVIPFRATSVLPLLGAGMLVILLSQLVTMLLRASLLVFLQTRIDTQIMPAFFEHLLSLPQSFFQKRSSGDILTRINSNTVIRDLISTQLVSAFLDGSLVIVYLIILMTQSLQFGILVVIIGMLQISLLLGTNGIMRAMSRRGLEAAGKTQGYVAEALSGLTTLKAAGAEQRAFTKWANLFFDQLNTTVRLNYIASTIGSFMTTLRTLSPLILLWVGTGLVLNGQMSIGGMLALNALATAFLTPLASLVSSGQQLQTVQAHLERIGDVLDAQPEQDVQRVQTPPQLSGRITLQNISFRYDNNSPMILKNISLHIEPGQKIALVGRSGSGKSTLGRLLLGLTIPTEGEIIYDGIPLRFLNYQAVRSQFGVVMQDAAVFSGTIRENIAFNAPDISLERIAQAAQMAAIHDDILAMQMGYETYVSEGGSALSGGQRQRLALARALAHAPAILLLDEATSALDVITEQKVEQNLRNVGCTQVIIAHRLSTVRGADRILVIDEGMLVEQGSHEELLKQNRYYARLIRSQLASGEIKSN